MEVGGHLSVVVLLGSEDLPSLHGALATESSPLGQVIRGADDAIRVQVISLGARRTFPSNAEHLGLDDTPPAAVDRLLRALGGYRLREKLSTFPIGRLINSMGPLAPSRVMWRTMKRSADAMRWLRASDVVVAMDLEATKTAWIAVHRGWTREAYVDPRTGIALLDPSRGERTD